VFYFSIFKVVTQFNFPFKGANKVPFAFNDVCSVFKNNPPGLEPLRHMLDISYNNTGRLKCFGPSRFGETQEQLQEMGFDLRASAGKGAYFAESRSKSVWRKWVTKGRGGSMVPVGDLSFELSWTYICCTYFGLPIAGGAKSLKMFSYAPNYNLPAINKYCQSLFWPSATLQPEPPINGSMLANTSNVIFSNMGFDPVRTFSIQNNISSTVTLLDIGNAGHTEDVVAYDTTESEDVTQARALEILEMAKWLRS
jgi:hypothetical protein